ncbi:MAG: RNase adapter RapZ [Acidimicrobiales bacterium]|nr:RNase adapter RapZ [Acidimicrobiales bacterium]|tara:strand:+ start:2162 stop:3034 length:873 start_codon:yes stop_codon:yes gene_type:complete
MTSRPDFIIVTGLSGAGRSTVADTLEDLGWFVIDNLPPSLLASAAELLTAADSSVERLALVAGSHEYQEDLLSFLSELRSSGARVRVLFLDAPTEVLLRRYDQTRRRHPLSAGSASVTDAIGRERELLEPIRREADVVIETGDLIVHELKARVVEAFSDADRKQLMQTTVMSFGYKHGVPTEADLVFDCRFLPNPHWVSELRPKTGLDQEVRNYVLEQPLTVSFMEHTLPLFEFLIPSYVEEGKAYLTIAFGCTGGRHRSVSIAEEFGRILTNSGHSLRTRHRDLESKEI